MVSCVAKVEVYVNSLNTIVFSPNNKALVKNILSGTCNIMIFVVFFL